MTAVAVNRSNEFLSCAKTALKIGKHQHRKDLPESVPTNAWWLVSASDLQLLDLSAAAASQHRLDDGLLLLDTMEAELKVLESLVRRRGQTNDPTQEIAAATQRLEQDTQALTEWLPTIVPPLLRNRQGQAAKHYAMIQEWFQTKANAQGKRLQEILKVRAQVLQDQARRRKQFQASSMTTATTTSSTASTSNSSSSTRTTPVSGAVGGGGRRAATPVVRKTGTATAVTTNNPLFQLSPPAGARPRQAAATTTTTQRSNGTATAAASAAKTANITRGGYSYYAASSPYATTIGGGYGGVGGGSGMRQRRTGAVSQQQQEQQHQEQEQTLLLQRQEERKSQMRLREAREAEKGLASLVGLFGKMTTLISEQSEQIDKIEDDVEAASMDVQKGQNAITEVYSLKKGNRPLIIRVFATLIFVIVFMRFYRG